MKNQDEINNFIKRIKKYEKKKLVELGFDYKVKGKLIKEEIIRRIEEFSKNQSIKIGG